MLNHIIKTQDFDTRFLSEIFDLTRDIKINSGSFNKCLEGKTVSILFYEPSTRTKMSFMSAVIKLGGNNIVTENASKFSSAAKGESLKDTIRVLGGYSDCIILRHNDRGSAQEASLYSKVPIINAGDGDGQHPTQSLLDLFTIEEHFGEINGLTVILSGDLMYSRTVHSLAYLLSKYKNVRIFLASPPGLELPQNILKHLEDNNVENYQFDSLLKAIDTGEANVVYHTRPQKERYLNNNSLVSYEESKNNFTITVDLANKMNKDSIILHPLPRTDEIEHLVDNNHRAKYFEQAENGLYVRMALLKYLFRSI